MITNELLTALILLLSIINLLLMVLIYKSMSAKKEGISPYEVFNLWHMDARDNIRQQTEVNSHLEVLKSDLGDLSNDLHSHFTDETELFANQLEMSRTIGAHEKIWNKLCDRLSQNSATDFSDLKYTID